MQIRSTSSFKNAPAFRSTRGFTLVELLVVIAIIATLASLSLGGIRTVRENARKTKTKKICTDLVNAVQLFENDYGTFPQPAQTGTGDQTFLTDSHLMNILLANETVQNQKAKPYIDLDDAGSTVVATATDGLVNNGTEAHLFDTWNKSGNSRYYTVICDSDYDNQITSPVDSTAPKSVIRGKKVIAYSTGKDGLVTVGTSKGGVNRDNVYSWMK